MQQEAGAVKMCTYVQRHMVIFVREDGKIYSPCKCRSVTICDNIRGADRSVIDQYTSSFIIQLST